jgi:hypothetical protein
MQTRVWKPTLLYVLPFHRPDTALLIADVNPSTLIAHQRNVCGVFNSPILLALHDALTIRAQLTVCCICGVGFAGRDAPAWRTHCSRRRRSNKRCVKRLYAVFYTTNSTQMCCVLHKPFVLLHQAAIVHFDLHCAAQVVRRFTSLKE